MRGEVTSLRDMRAFKNISSHLNQTRRKIVCKSLKRGNLGANDLYDEDEI